MKKIIYPFAYNYLLDRLYYERESLKEWKYIIEKNSDEFAVKQAKGNLNSTNHRIEELLKVLDLCKEPLKEDL